MNNEQFRKLLLANSAKSSGASKDASTSSPGGRTGGSTPSALGSKQKSSIPMTPRSVVGRVDFARQLAQRSEEGQQLRQNKKFRTSAPRGSKLSQGYVDRAQARQQEEEDERVGRLEALSESFKNDKIDRATYERLQMQIAGGDLTSTHLVKGLDYKLLERIRKGEDVYEGPRPHSEAEKSRSAEEGEGEEEEEEEENPDDVLDELEAHEVVPLERGKVQKKGQLAPASLVPAGQKRTRDQILAEMKAAREAAKADQQSALGSRFKKISTKPTPEPRIERDGRGREILIITDENGNERRKVRKVDPSAQGEGRRAFEPAKDGDVLGMEVPEFYRQQQLAKAKEEEEREQHIFDGAGSDYDPLRDLGGSDDEASSSAEEGEAQEEREPTTRSEAADGRGEGESRSPPPKPPRPSGPRNYFGDSGASLLSSATPATLPSLSDPAIVAALEKARALEAGAKSEEDMKAAEREARLKKMLESTYRDDEDLDIGFGTNRLEDEADMDETEVKLSVWGDEDEEGGTTGGKAKRKRGPKKRKGDKNSFADVMRVMERRRDNGG